jgi:hypothetical protein
LAASYQEVGIKTGTLIPIHILSEELKLKVYESYSRKKKRKSKFLKQNGFLMILTQECDLNKPSCNYPTIEVIYGIQKNKLDDRLTRAKNSRKLLIEHPVSGLLEFETDLISIIEKTDFEKFILDNSSNLIESPNQLINYVIEWRMLSYNREPFPDKVNILIRDFMNIDEKNRLKELLQRGNEVHKLMAFVYPEREGESHYYLSLTILLFERAGESKESIRKEFSSVLDSLQNHICDVTILNSNSSAVPPTSIVEQDVPMDQVVLPSDIQLSDFMKLREYNLEYLSYTDETGGRFDG